VDVRTPNEFAQSHVPGAVNVPLPDIPDGVLQRVPDKDRPLLLHCLGGGRSGLAQRPLRRAGYTRVFNLGSHGRAARIVKSGENPGH
jgi:phage shock protein E